MKQSLQNTNLQAYFDGAQIVFGSTPKVGSVSIATITDLASAIPVGTVIDWPFNATIPNGFLLLNGQSISKSTYSDLYAKIGSRYGETSTHFSLWTGRSFNNFDLQFISQTIAGTALEGIAITPNGDVYVAAKGGDIYYQQEGEGNFVALNQAGYQWHGLTSDLLGNVYASVYSTSGAGPGICLRTGGTGDFASLSQTNRNYKHMCCAPNGDIYVGTASGDIYVRAGGIGDFVGVGTTSRNWQGIVATSNGDIYASVYGGDIYKKNAGGSTFDALSIGNKNWVGMSVNSEDAFLAGVASGDLWYTSNPDIEFINLNQKSREHDGIAINRYNQIYIVFGNNVVKSTNAMYDWKIIKY